LVTGAAGFIGSHIVDLLVARGDQVVALDALLPQAHAGPPPDRPGRPELIVADVRDAALLDRLLTGVDAVCHQAAMVGHGLDPADAPEYVGHNDHGTAVLLAAMYRAGVGRLVLASSMVVYGEGRYTCASHGTVRPGPRRDGDIAAGRFDPTCPHCAGPLESALVPEDAPLHPRGVYAATKVAQEHLAEAWAAQGGGTGWALRYHNVYGPWMPRDTPYAGVASLFRSALAGGRAPRVLEDGRQRRDFVHVGDVARANVLALTRPAPAPLTPVNICSGEPRTVGELARALSTELAGPEPVIAGGARAADVRHIVADPARAGQLLGFRARVGFAAGIAEFATAPLRDPARVNFASVSSPLRAGG
jgi:dTDP-L-rhamnose 4-epimerase